MMIVRFDDARVFDLPGLSVHGCASAARRATETMTSRVELDGRQRVPDHAYREDASHLPPRPNRSE
jgi:hypothetical protein